jgi:glycine/D-amino acid oxidase-like deaminating enzyme
VFGKPEDFFRILTAQDYSFAKNIEGGIVTHEPGLDMEEARKVILGTLANLGVEITTNTEVLRAKKRSEGEFILSIRTGDSTSEYHCAQVVNAGGYKCRELDYQLGDRTNYTLSLEAKCIVRDVTRREPMPAFYVVRGGFIHITPIGDGSLSCLNTGTKNGGYVDTITLDNENTSIPSEWQEIMTTGQLPDATKRQRAMIDYANSTFLVDRQLEPVALVPGISTSFSSARQNRTQRKANIVTPGWQTIVPTKATHALELAREALDNAREYSIHITSLQAK